MPLSSPLKMNECRLCPRQCRVDRSVKRGYCGRTDDITVARSSLHMWEEPPISGTKGSGTVFFTGCNMRCIFCQNHEISFGDNEGRKFTPAELSDLFFDLVEQGAHNINLVTPTHYAEKIAEALSFRRLPVPVVYNSGGYDSVETLRSLEGLVDIYLPDFKYAQADLAQELSNAGDYPERALEAIREMRRQQPENTTGEDGLLKKGVIIRHLILPLHTKNSMQALELISENFPGTPVSLMAQYTPIGKFPDHPELERGITKRELAKVRDKMFDLGIDGFIQDRKSVSKDFIPDFGMYNS